MIKSLLKPFIALRAWIREWRAAPSRWRFPTQAVRVGVIFLAIIVGALLLRQKFIPESFGELGHYRAVAVTENAALEPQFAGWQACAICHSDKVETKNASYHRHLSCETCHGPASDHKNNPMTISPEVPAGREPCLTCHVYLASRPTGFAQIIEERHNPALPCSGCHEPHDPTPPSTPQECAACHNSIARTIAVSAHAPLDCEVCHSVGEEHKVRPRANLAQKPTERAFCGSCHDTKATPPDLLRGVDLTQFDIPRINLVTHGGTFVCWQCHFQHSPEAR